MCAQPIEHRVSHFVGYCIVRQTRVNSAGKLTLCLALVKAKRYFTSGFIVERVSAFKRSRLQKQLGSVGAWIEAPGYMSTQRLAESRVDDAGNRIHHLILEAFV